VSEILRVEEVSRAFGGLMAVNDVSFGVADGEILGLIGPNGAGKTTLFNVISGYYPPTKGRTYFLERDITGLRPYHLAVLGIGRTFQIVRPFPQLTVLENVMVGAFLRTPHRPTAEARARDVLELTGLTEVASRRASSLPIAGRKRVEVARALATQPRLLLLDEVVAGLNPTEVDQMVELIRRVRDTGVSIVVVEHVMRFIMGISDRVIVLSYGRLIAGGPPRQVAQDPGVIEAYLGEEAAGADR
jgi:branched-chain amino acid transport system ATP-binding protein